MRAKSRRTMRVARRGARRRGAIRGGKGARMRGRDCSCCGSHGSGYMGFRDGALKPALVQSHPPDAPPQMTKHSDSSSESKGVHGAGEPLMRCARCRVCRCADVLRSRLGQAHTKTSALAESHGRRDARASALGARGALDLSNPNVVGRVRRCVLARNLIRAGGARAVWQRCSAATESECCRGGWRMRGRWQQAMSHG
jgi:hypothetical protein